MVAAEQGRLRQQYEARLTELEAERQGAEADLAQVRVTPLHATPRPAAPSGV